MFIAKMSPSQVYWLNKIIDKYKANKQIDVEVTMQSFSDCIVYNQSDIRIRFEKDNDYKVINIDYLGREILVTEEKV